MLPSLSGLSPLAPAGKPLDYLLHCSAINFPQHSAGLGLLLCNVKVCIGAFYRAIGRRPAESGAEGALHKRRGPHSLSLFGQPLSLSLGAALATDRPLPPALRMRGRLAFGVGAQTPVGHLGLAARELTRRAPIFTKPGWICFHFSIRQLSIRQLWAPTHNCWRRPAERAATQFNLGRPLCSGLVEPCGALWTRRRCTPVGLLARQQPAGELVPTL